MIDFGQHIDSKLAVPFLTMPQPSELRSLSWHVDPLHRFLQQKLSCTVPSIYFRKTRFSPKHANGIIVSILLVVNRV